MSAAINRGILLKTRSTPTETVDTGEAYFWLEGSSLKYKDDTQTTITLGAGVTAEQVQDIVGTFITSGNSKLTAVYNDAGDSFVITLVEANIVHQNLSGAGTNTHAQIDSHISNTSNPHATTAAQVGADTVGSAAAAQAFAIQRANHVGSQLSSTISDFSEATQDAIGGILTDSTTIDFTYNDAGNQITAAVIPGGVNHNSLLNGGGTTHTDHSTVSIIAGTSMNGGGDITASRTLNHNNFGTAGTYGSASSVPVFVTEITGHITSVTSTAISILSTAVSDFASAVRSVVLTGISFVDSAVLATDSILVAIGKLQGQLTQRVSDFNAAQLVQNNRLDALESTDAKWLELIKTSADQLTNSNTTLTNITDLQFSATSGKTYYIEMTLVFRTAATTTGLAFTLGTSDTAAGDMRAQVNIPIAIDGTAAIYGGNITALGDIVIATGVQTAVSNFIATVRGVFICTTSGTIVPQFRSEVSGSNAAIAIGSVALVRIF